MKLSATQILAVATGLFIFTYVWAEPPPPDGPRKNGKRPPRREEGSGDDCNRGSRQAASAPLPPGTTAYHLAIPPYFPPVELPPDNPLTQQGVQLGQKLFSDARLSINDRQSCASCHQTGAGFVDRGKAVSLGAEGQTGTRNAMALFNLAWKDDFFWDGRARTLREQVLMPIQNKIEMHETLPHLVTKLSATSDYPALFAKAFGSPEITSDRLARALEQYLLTLIAADSKYDKSRRGEVKLTAEEERGLRLFTTESDPRRGLTGAGCARCHGGPMFSSRRFSNNGLDVVSKDLGRYEVTGRENDRGRFTVPSLRNIELTAPYMHDGRFKTLEAVVEHYNSGVKRSPTLDRNLARHPATGLNLSTADKKALVAFMKTLTDDRYRPNNLQVAQLP